MKETRDERLKKCLERMLKRRGKQLLHLECRKCGTVGFAASLAIADILAGWAKLRKLKEFHYRGLCIDCRPRKPTSKKRRKS
jgi:hypothetical protein